MVFSGPEAAAVVAADLGLSGSAMFVMRRPAGGVG
jgi:hypothetical protein